MFAPLLVALIEVSGVTIVSDVTCPPTDSVVAHLQGLIGDDASSTPLAVQLRLDDGVVFLERRDGAGRVTARRRLEAASCDERARIAAIAIAAWTIPEAALPDASTPPVTSAAAPPPMPVLVQTAAPRLRRQLALEASLGFFGAFDRNGFAPGAAAELSLGEQHSGWAARLGFFGTAPRSSAVGQGIGSVAWERHTLYTGARYRFVAMRWRVDVGSDLLFGLLHVSGRGFEVNSDAFGFDFGLGGGVRLSRAWKRVAPFVALSVAGWLIERTATIGFSYRTKTIPIVDGMLTVGVSYANF